MNDEFTEKWDARYRSGDIPWDLGQPSQPVLDLVARHLTTPARILVPGCGRGWEVEALAQVGFDVIGLDLSPEACTIANQRMLGCENARVEQGDFLQLPEHYHGAFDAVVEHTCYCAIEPESRKLYRSAVLRALKESGLLLGIFLNFEGGGPPHGTSPQALKAHFGSHFSIEELSPIEAVFTPKNVPQIALAMRARS